MRTYQHHRDLLEQIFDTGNDSTRYLSNGRCVDPLRIGVHRNLNATIDGKQIPLSAGIHIWTITNGALKRNGDVPSSTGKKLRDAWHDGTTKTDDVLWLRDVRVGFSPSQYAKVGRLQKRTVCAWLNGLEHAWGDSWLYGTLNAERFRLHYNPHNSPTFHLYKDGPALDPGTVIPYVRIDRNGAFAYFTGTSPMDSKN
jgi:hypothetical protein